MQVSIIAAMDEHRAIGIKNQLPWHLPADLKHFKNLTIHKPIVMGRKTFESIGKALPDRTNIVVSRNANFQASGCYVRHSLKEALNHLEQVAEVMIIGGANVFKEALPISNRMYLTFIHHQFEADSFFPKWNEHEWQEIYRENHAADEKNIYSFSFVTLERTLNR